jgi:hypothetical protein
MENVLRGQICEAAYAILTPVILTLIRTLPLRLSCYESLGGTFVHTASNRNINDLTAGVKEDGV